jgi:DNA-binding transcriptional ArsR family regulator
MDALQVIAEPRRRRILALVWDRELPAADIAGHFDVTFGAVSQHLAVLREAEFVTVRKDGNRRFYRADQDSLGPFKQVLETMWGDTLQQMSDSIEAEDQ